MGAMDVAVIGAGVAGLQAIRSLKERGFNVMCFDAEDGCGGQWHQNYSSLHLQVPKEVYEFLDMENEDVPRGAAPSCAEMFQHCEKYVERFGLREHIRYSHEVVSLSQGQAKPWKVTFRQVRRYKRAAGLNQRPSAEPVAANEEQEFDYVILATGPFSHRQPHVPKVPGMEEFEGQILHSSMNIGDQTEKGKRVVVVGAAKSAFDQAVQACRGGATSVTQVMRRAHWAFPGKVLGILPFKFFFFSRFGEALIHTYQGSCAPPAPWGFARRLLNAILFPLAWLIVKCLELIFVHQLSLHGAMRPRVDLVRDFGAYGFVMTAGHIEFREKELLVPKIGEIVRYTRKGVVVREEDGTETLHECDMVVYGTGFEKRYDVFAPEIRARLGDTSKGLSLYRQILHPELPSFAFVGSEFNTISNLVSSGLQAEWVARKLAGDVGKGFHPTAEEMRAEMAEKARWKLDKMDQTPNARNVDLQQINHQDTLLMDMGERRFRKLPNVFAELFTPYTCTDYFGIVGAPLKNKSAGPRRVATESAEYPPESDVSALKSPLLAVFQAGVEKELISTSKVMMNSWRNHPSAGA